MKNIKLIVATHKQAKMPSDSNLYLPIHVGREGKADIGYIGDNTGENISHLNPYYSELTGLYWAWKNVDCDYLGLVHYRRFFTMKKQAFHEGVDIDQVVLTQADLEQLLEQADVLVPSRRKYYIETLESHYENTLDKTHLPAARQIIEELSPSYLTAFDQVLGQTSGYMFNMFVMKKEAADRYFEWLFPILERLIEVVGVDGYSAFHARYPGRVSEILFNVWLKEQDMTVKEVPFMYLEKVNLVEKGISFLKAKFLGKKYGESF
ncbi:TPA: DUF4422 domain-containing protein [Streptococcus suis]|nr:DUF4422 domain-containing protein [Streptococcus suis]